ncbi:MAG: RidA family protein [Chloroflexi bacterium]|nr:RidA family protein [Chloroflexota bacterium]
MSAEQRLVELGIELPPPVQPLGSYTTWVREGGLLFLSGHVPVADGKMIYTGKVGDTVSVERAQEAARFTIINSLATIKAALGSLDRVRRVIRVSGFVLSTPDFAGHASVLNGASELLAQVFGEQGLHVRNAIGAASLPGDATVELELTLAVE